MGRVLGRRRGSRRRESTALFDFYDTGGCLLGQGRDQESHWSSFVQLTGIVQRSSIVAVVIGRCSLYQEPTHAADELWVECNASSAVSCHILISPHVRISIPARAGGRHPLGLCRESLRANVRTSVASSASSCIWWSLRCLVPLTASAPQPTACRLRNTVHTLWAFGGI